MQLFQNLNAKEEKSDDLDIPLVKTKSPDQEKNKMKKQIALDDALTTMVKSNNIASLTVRVLIESLWIYLFNDEDLVANVNWIELKFSKIHKMFILLIDFN